jgi:hypothetical protein
MSRLRLFYLVSAIVITVIILIIASAQFASTCTWSLINSTASPVLVLLGIAALGVIIGGLLVLLWKTPEKDEYEDSVEQKDIGSDEK